MLPCQLPKSIDREIEMLHLPPDCLSDDAFARRKSAGGVALETMKLAPLRDFAGVDGGPHRGAEAVEIRTGSSWNLPGRLPDNLNGY